jgi:hypothetical protein
LRRANTDGNIVDRIQARTFLKGLQIHLMPFAGISNPGTLAVAINAARNAELGFEYQNDQVNPRNFRIGNEEEIGHRSNYERRKESAVEPKGELEKKMEEMIKKFGDMEIKMMDQGRRNGNNNEEIVCYNCNRKGHRSFECRSAKRKIVCFKCNEEGHIAPRCPKNRTERRNEEVHRFDVIYDSESEEEREMHNAERRHNPYRKGKRVRIEEEPIEEKNVQSKDKGRKVRFLTQEQKEKMKQAREAKHMCRKCKVVGKHYTRDCPNVSEDQYREELKERNKIQRKLGKENFDDEVVKSLMRSLRKINREESMNIMDKERRYTAMRTNVGIEGIEIEAIIDSGAAICAITKELIDELGIEIDKPSKVRISTMVGKTNSLGRINNLEMIIEGKKVLANFEVFEGKGQNNRFIILGNDWFNKNNAMIDWKKRALFIQGEEDDLKIPVNFIKEELEEEYEEYEESEEEY